VCRLCRGVLIAWGPDQTLLHAHSRSRWGISLLSDEIFWARKGRKKRRNEISLVKIQKKKRVGDR